MPTQKEGAGILRHRPAKGDGRPPSPIALVATRQARLSLVSQTRQPGHAAAVMEARCPSTAGAWLGVMQSKPRASGVALPFLPELASTGLQLPLFAPRLPPATYHSTKPIIFSYLEVHLYVVVEVEAERKLKHQSCHDLYLWSPCHLQFSFALRKSLR